MVLADPESADPCFHPRPPPPHCPVRYYPLPDAKGKLYAK